MTQQEHRLLSVEEAARILYRTDAPTEQQLGKIRMKLVRGILARGSKGGWTTTPEAIADYLAHREAALRDERRAHGALAAAKQVNGKTSARRRTAAVRNPSPPEVKSLYGELLRDYFLALALRRNRKSRSRCFDQAVIFGQVSMLLLAGTLLYSGYQRVTAQAPERAAVLDWLDKNAKEYDVVEWFPADRVSQPGATILRVKYKYFSSSRKRIVTDRQFTLRNGQVAGVMQSE